MSGDDRVQDDFALMLIAVLISWSLSLLVRSPRRQAGARRRND
jgi:hypothetical protein